MSWTLTVSALTRGEQTINAFGSLAFAGNYTSGGDAAGALGYGANTAGFPQLRMESVIHAGQMPISGRVDLGNGYQGQFLPSGGAGILPALKIFVAATGAELAAGAYPAALTGASSAQASLTYAKNI